MSVNGMPHHILDIRPVITLGYQCPSGGSEEDNACNWEEDGGSILMEGGGGGELLDHFDTHCFYKSFDVFVNRKF